MEELKKLVEWLELECGIDLVNDVKFNGDEK